MKRAHILIISFLFMLVLSGCSKAENAELVISANRLDRYHIITDTVLHGNGEMSNNEYYATTDYISVSPGETIQIQFGPHGGGHYIGMRVVVAYDATKNVLEYSENVDKYSIPEEGSFIRISARKDWLVSDFARVNINHANSRYEMYYEKSLKELARDNRTDISSLLNYPLSSLPDYVLNNLAYKPLGPLEKGYICFVSDDGQAQVETYTIPLFLRKNVPCTLAIMSTSAVLQTETGLDAVLDAVNNHGFCVAQHGGSYWDVEDEFTLNAFFNKEEIYWNNVGITPFGAVVPGHKTNNIIRAVCGGRFGCLRTGYKEGTPYYGDDYYINGPRSNIYGLTSINIKDLSLEKHKEAVKLTSKNHYLRIIHFHESDLTVSDRNKLEKIIDYAKESGLSFITLQDIPWIN